MQQQFAHCCIYQKYKNFRVCFFAGEVVAAIVVATARCTRVATSTESNPN
jgi:hypothetical protein